MKNDLLHLYIDVFTRLTIEKFISDIGEFIEKKHPYVCYNIRLYANTEFYFLLDITIDNEYEVSIIVHKNEKSFIRTTTKIDEFLKKYEMNNIRCFTKCFCDIETL